MHWASGIPHALKGREINANLGRIAPRGRGPCLESTNALRSLWSEATTHYKLRHSGMRRQGQARNLEIPGSMLSHRPGMTVMGLRAEPLCADPLARNDGAGSLRIEVMRSSTARRETHSSCPDLIRASINLHNKFFRRRWITGSSSAKTRFALSPGDDGFNWPDGSCHALQSAAAQENVAATLPSPESSITTLSPAVSQIVFTRLPVSTISPAERPLPSEAR